MKIKALVESRQFEIFITAVIIFNALVLGLETQSDLSPSFKTTLLRLDQFFLFVFVVELTLKGFVYRSRFFSDSWRVFDFLIVGLSLLPASGPLAILRALRVLRTLRMISVLPALRRVVSGLVVAIPGLGAVSVIMALIFYVGAVIATQLFGQDFPEWFGSIAASSYTLFQVMTLESWSMGIVRPVMDVFPYAWLFFLPFILLTTFTMLNLFIAVIVNAMQAETDQAAKERADQGHQERIEMLNEIKHLRMALEALNFNANSSLSERSKNPSSLNNTLFSTEPLASESPKKN